MFLDSDELLSYLHGQFSMDEELKYNVVFINHFETSKFQASSNR